jgi:hypothetical protein
MLNTVDAPTTATTAETFLWYRASDRLSLGVAHLWKQNAFRALGSYLVSPETDRLPSTHVSAGVQGIGTGNPGFSATAEKNFDRLNLFVGLGYRTNSKLLRPVGGFKYRVNDAIAVGLQDDGIERYPFATYSWDRYTVGAYLIAFQRPALLVGTRF